MAGFNVNIGANTFQLTKSLAELRTDLANFKKQLSTSTDSQTVVKLNQAIAQTEKQIKSISGAQNLNAIGQSIKQLPPGFNQAGFAVGNFSRIVQDAPFSFLSGNLIAVSNNIDPLIQSFVQLKQQTGSGAAAFKALGSSLIGSGGLLLGFSLVNAAITYFSARQSFAKKEVEGFAKAQSESNKEAGEQIAHLRVLAAAAANTTNSTKERKSAAEELTKALKENNVQLTQEEALNNRAAAAIDTATKAILERAKARAIENRVAELTAQNLDREIKKEDLTERLIEPTKRLNAEREKALKGQRLLISTPEGAQALRVVEGFTAQIKKLDEETGKATTEINALIAKVTEPPKTGDKDAVVDLLKRRVEALKQLESEAGLTTKQRIELAQLEIAITRRDAVKLQFTKAEVDQLIQGIIQKHFPDGVDIPVRGRIKIEKIEQDIDISAALGLEEIDLSSWDALIEAMKRASAAKKELLGTEQEQAYADFVSSTLGPAFTDLFENIASDGSNALEEFGKSIVNIIKRLLAAAAAAIVLSVILKAIFPGAAGTGFGDIFGKLIGVPKFATGGIVTGPTLGVIGEMNRPEAILPLDRLPQILNQLNMGSGSDTLTAHVSGDGLLFVLNRAQKKQGRIL